MRVLERDREGEIERQIHEEKRRKEIERYTKKGEV